MLDMLRIDARCYVPMKDGLSLQLDRDEALIIGNLLLQKWVIGRLVVSADPDTITAENAGGLACIRAILDGEEVRIGDHKLKRIKDFLMEADGKRVRLR